MEFLVWLYRVKLCEALVLLVLLDLAFSVITFVTNFALGIVSAR